MYSVMCCVFFILHITLNFLGFFFYLCLSWSFTPTFEAVIIVNLRTELLNLEQHLVKLTLTRSSEKD